MQVQPSYTFLFEDDVIFFLQLRTCSCHTEEGNLQAGNSEKLRLKSTVRPSLSQQKNSNKMKTLLNKTWVMYIHAGAIIRIRIRIIIRMRIRIMFLI